MTKPTGGAAFARPGSEWRNESGVTLFTGAQTGMTLRDYFAGQALAGIMACGTMMHAERAAAANALVAYRTADAMIAKRDRRDA